MVSNEILEMVYDRALNVTSCASLTVIPFTIVVVLRYTPKPIRHYSFFLINSMTWSLIGNVIVAIFHPVPLMPLLCFKLSGILHQLFSFDHEFVGHNLALGTMTIAMNGVCALFIAFQFRYMSMAQFTITKKIKPFWGYLYCIILHLLVTVLIMVSYKGFMISIVEYGIDPVLVDTTNLFCFESSGHRKNLSLGVVFAYSMTVAFGIMIFSSLCFAKLRKKTNVFQSSKTMKLQRSLLRNLVALSSIPFVLSIPGLTVLAALYFNAFTDSRLLCSIAIVPITNHGTIMAIVTIFMFKDYRQAVLRIAHRTMINWTMIRFLRYNVPKVQPRY
uniref:Serpentine Receptor, class H n=1 Tax=Steinernema glaseri TaxID=37863 RepID=A0A1I7YKV6_9BILA